MKDLSKPIDPRTTRRTVSLRKFVRDSALYLQFTQVGYTTVGTEPSVVLERKPEFCQRRAASAVAAHP